MIDNEEYHESPEPIPPLAEVAAAYHDVSVYNYRHTGMARAMAGFFSSEVRIADEGNGDEGVERSDGSAASPAVGEAIERRLSRAESRQMEGDATSEINELIHGATFAAVGVEMVHVSTDGSFTAFGPRDLADEVKPLVVDLDRYVEFLGTLDKDELQSNVRNLAMPTDIIHTLEGIVRRGYGELEPESEADDDYRETATWALRTFAKMEPEYERLGIDKPELYQQLLEISDPDLTEWEKQGQAERYLAAYDRLKNYVRYWGRDVLPEYMELYDELSVGPQTGYFEFDMTDQLAARVDRILELQKEDRTRKFGTEAARAKFQSLTQTLQNLAIRESRQINTRQNRKFIRDQLERLRPYI